MVMRVYLPATMRTLRMLATEAELGPAPLTAFAVTAALRAFYEDDDPEALEYAALAEAARASLRLLDADPLVVRRRVVVVAEADDSAVNLRPDLDRAAVRVAEPVRRGQVRAVHVDDADAEESVAAAAARILEADLGSQDAQFVVDGAEGNELGWYAPQELDALVELTPEHRLPPRPGQLS
jgi:hypothetical protein